MFEALTKKFQNLFTRVKNLTEDNLQEVVKEVKTILLSADVNFSVVEIFVAKVKTKVLGQNLIKSLSPREQFIKIIHEELVDLMGKDVSDIKLTSSPSMIMLCGLQGCGKTTQCAKLARYIQKKYQKKPLLVACDLKRPAAIEQLRKLASDASISFFSSEDKNPVNVVKKACDKAKEEGLDVIILDTAGRLHIDEEMMQELVDLKNTFMFDEILFVASAAIGQNAAEVAKEFAKNIDISGSILTMLDSDAKGGAAISIREVTQRPLKFEGIGEKLDDFQPFNPSSMADRILGMGDVINLARKAEENFSKEDEEDLEKKFKEASFNFDDYLKQMGMIKKMGPLSGVMKMMPGMGDFGDFDMAEDELKRVEAMIKSMTKAEREDRVELTHSRRKRISMGAGVALDEVNRMIKAFKRLKQMFKEFSGSKKSIMANMGNLKKQMGGNLWR
jgi:signal recognition particle subunit SRP54